MICPTRSELSAPASSWRKIERAIASPADVALLDLEDSVAPSEKEASRRNVINAVRELDWGTKPPAYRVNGLDTEFFYLDLIEVVEAAGDRLSLIVVPKVNRPEDVVVVDTLLYQIELRMGFEPNKIGLEAQIETAAGLVNVERIAGASPRLRALNFGPGDFAAGIHMPVTAIGTAGPWDELYPGHRFHYPMSRIAVAARATGVRAIDGPVADYRDPGAFRTSCLLARSLGYDGKWCIHPDQVPIANQVFSPSDEEIAGARRVVDTYQEALREGSGVVSMGGTMIDSASIRLAEVTLELARRIGMIHA